MVVATAAEPPPSKVAEQPLYTADLHARIQANAANDMVATLTEATKPGYVAPTPTSFVQDMAQTISQRTTKAAVDNTLAVGTKLGDAKFVPANDPGPPPRAEVAESAAWVANNASEAHKKMAGQYIFDTGKKAPPPVTVAQHADAIKVQPSDVAAASVTVGVDSAKRHAESLATVTSRLPKIQPPAKSTAGEAVPGGPTEIGAVAYNAKYNTAQSVQAATAAHSNLSKTMGASALPPPDPVPAPREEALNAIQDLAKEQGVDAKFMLEQMAKQLDTLKAPDDFSVSIKFMMPPFDPIVVRDIPPAEHQGKGASHGGGDPAAGGAESK